MSPTRWNFCYEAGDKEINMIEKVNPMHPDKVADRIAGAIVDLAYASEDNPKIAAEVLIGHCRSSCRRC